jgi:carbon-monoxide dehydrogenase small subunit
MTKVMMTVNGKSVSAETEGRTLLSAYLREGLGLTGTHIGCDTSQCGACVVHVDGVAVKSCSVFAQDVAGSKAGISGSPRAPVRLLHAGHGDVLGGFAGQ